MNKKVFFVVVILVLGGLAGYAYFHTRVPKQEVQVTPTNGLATIVFPEQITTESVQNNALPVTGPLAEGQQAHWIEGTGTYPTNTPFAEQAKEHVTTRLADFITQSEPDFAEIQPFSRGYTISIDTAVTHGTRLMTYMYQDYEYTGGAHGNTVYTTQTLDSTGKTYALADLFLPTANFLPVISQAAIDYFSTDPNVQYDPNDEVWSEGLKPLAENFSTFYIKDDSIVFKIAQYQIGPYVIGAPEFSISVTDPRIKDLIRPELFAQ